MKERKAKGIKIVCEKCQKISGVRFNASKATTRRAHTFRTANNNHFDYGNIKARVGGKSGSSSKSTLCLLLCDGFPCCWV